jgi:ribosomal protein L35AE/L33A
MVTEGDSGTVAATFTVSLETPSGRALSVDYATANATATAPADYVAASGTLNFGAGQTSREVTVVVNGDVLDEANETYTVNLSSPTNVTIGDGQGLGTITDDDPLPAIAIGDATVAEGNSGTVNATFALSLDAPSGRPVTVTYATEDGTAIAPGDYVAGTGTVTFPSGQMSRNVTVVVKGDTVDESNETYSVELTNPGNATITDGEGIGTIIDDDGSPSLSVDDVVVTEGDSGTINASFTVSLSGLSGQTVSVGYATADEPLRPRPTTRPSAAASCSLPGRRRRRSRSRCAGTPSTRSTRPTR